MLVIAILVVAVVATAYLFWDTFHLTLVEFDGDLATMIRDGYVGYSSP